MTEHGSPYVDGPHPDGSHAHAHGAGRPGPEPLDPVARVDLQRAQQARYGTEPHPDAALLASRLTRVAADAAAGAASPAGPAAPPLPGGPTAADVAAAAGVPASVGTPQASSTAPPVGPAALTALPLAPPGEREESTVKLTPAGPARPRPRPSPRPRALGLITGAGEPPLGIVEGPASATTKAPAAVARALGRAAPVGDLFEPAGFEPAGPVAGSPDHGAGRRWTAELERMARVGTWRYELVTGTLHRSEPLQEIYGERGVEPDGSGGPVEGEQVALLVRSLRGDTGLRDHEAELALPGVRLSCRAEVEVGPDGAPARLIGVVRDVTAQFDLEARARHAARRFADLAALVPTGVAIVDRDGVVREVNPALCALLDASPEQVRGLPVAALCAEPGPDP
ncbi:MAG TPA: PAS domain-containing protein, partial [Pseudonocardia sp.]|nr:PAS domain-containing protein [Pseudonocardia sp.]